MHTLLGLRGSVPAGNDIKPAKIQEIRVFDQLLPEPGAFYLLVYAKLYRELPRTRKSCAVPAVGAGSH